MDCPKCGEMCRLISIGQNDLGYELMMWHCFNSECMWSEEEDEELGR